MSLCPASSRALTVRTTAPDSSSTSTRAPAVTYSPASMVQRSPKGMPQPALAPIRQCSPMEMTICPPPESVPMVLALPPRSVLAPSVTPCETRPSTMFGPKAPALKLRKPSCITVVPSPK